MIMRIIMTGSVLISFEPYILFHLYYRISCAMLPAYLIDMFLVLRHCVWPKVQVHAASYVPLSVKDTVSFVRDALNLAYCTVCLSLSQHILFSLPKRNLYTLKFITLVFGVFWKCVYFMHLKNTGTLNHYYDCLVSRFSLAQRTCNLAQFFCWFLRFAKWWNDINRPWCLKLNLVIIDKLTSIKSQKLASKFQLRINLILCLLHWSLHMALPPTIFIVYYFAGSSPVSLRCRVLDFLGNVCRYYVLLQISAGVHQALWVSVKMTQSERAYL